MARPGRKKKDVYENLPEDFKNSVDGAGDDKILDMLGEVAKSEEANLRAKEADEDLKQKQEEAKFAGEGYSETTKANRLKRRYLYDVLRARGKIV